ncbi:uncharacterized protein LOC113778156 isoform X2 [Coffea eugenioides]|uniref:uncharacterized protein LOC113778156 isoform X2 n=1 Tax=Coffea eugenioides TaxID=49369 RepID=UPI000F61083F|nr:uncharacterized protein LOC113778156 isoform X2 [Coffea eugenioides]
MSSFLFQFLFLSLHTPILDFSCCFYHPKNTYFPQQKPKSHSSVMPKSNRIVTPLLFFLISSTFTYNCLVFASPVPEQSLKRPDPLRHFKPYNGVYDIRNRHYWASAAFTGIHGYAVAGIWFLFGLGFGSYLILKNLFGSCFRIVNYPHSFYIATFSLVVLFTLLAIIASSFVFAASKSSQKRANRLVDTVFGAASDASGAMRRVINSLVDMQALLRPYDPQTCNLLNVTSHRLRRESLLIKDFVAKTKHPSHEAVEILYSTTVAVVTINLMLLVAALVLLILHWYPGIMVIIFCCWILTTLSWILTGFDYFFQTFARDTCSALVKFEENPDDSSLRFIHPCASPSDSNNLLVQIGKTVHNFISQANTKLTELKAVLGIQEGNEDTLGFQEICDPFASAPNYVYAPQNCHKDAIPIGDLPNILSRFTCYKGNSSEECLIDGRFLPEASYVMAEAYSHSIQDLINVFPDLLSLTQCTSVKQAFSDIVVRQCKPFKTSVRMLWSSALSLSLIMTVLVSLWVAKTCRDRHRSFAKFSIVPKPA